MKLFVKNIVLVLMLSMSTGLFCITTYSEKRLPDYDEFVLKNKLLQDINVLLEGKYEPERKK
jgi:hypothetical protein